MSSLLTETDVFPWAERVLHGNIVAARRQGGRESGGRPGWFIDLQRADGITPYYIRGHRGGDFGYIQDYGLQREVRLLKLLKEEGIPVPEVIAAADEPNAAIMHFVEGVNDFTEIGDPAERDRVARDFARIMAQWHAIPAEKFAEIGLAVPGNAEQLVTADLGVWERGHFPLLVEPVPIVTFACQWLRRNLPEMPERLVLVQGDTGPGQFLFKQGRVQAVVDWELAALGDPMRELAHIRTRDVWYPTGNLPDWFRYYSEFSGVPLDVEKIRYYSVIGMLTTALALGPVVQRLNPRDEHAEWIAQDVWSKKATSEMLAEATGIELRPIQIPRPDCPYVSSLFDALEDNLKDEQGPHIQDSFLQHRMQMTLRLVAHMRNIAEIGAEIAELELDDMQALLGSRPRTVRDGHRAMDQLVRNAGPDLDAALIQYFYRHALREEALMRGGLGRAEWATVSSIT